MHAYAKANDRKAPAKLVRLSVSDMSEIAWGVGIFSLPVSDDAVAILANGTRSGAYQEEPAPAILVLP